MRRWLVASLVVLAVLLPSSAFAQAPGFETEDPGIAQGGPTPGYEGGVPSDAESHGEGDVPLGHPGAPAAPFAPQRIERCSTRRRVRTCRYYVNGKLERVCTKRRTQPEQCYVDEPATRRRASQAARSAKFPARLLKRLQTKGKARAAVSILHGESAPVLAPVGRFYRGTQGWCSGTLIKRGVVLTAAHCLWDQSGGVIGVRNYFPGLTFYPGHRFFAGSAIGDYGGWQVVQSFVPQAYADGDNAADWGLAVLAPDGSGNYAGDYTGTYTAWGNVRIIPGTPFYNLGYPASYGWLNPTLGGGNSQYFCYMTWDGDVPQGYNLNPAYRNGFWFFWPNACPMHGGSSGGPNFVTLFTGEAAIVAVNNRGINDQDAAGRPKPNGFSVGTLNTWFDQRFLDFANVVLAILRGG